MKKTLSALCVIISVAAMIVYFMRTSPHTTIADFTGLLLFVPTVASIPGLILALLSHRERKSRFAIALIIINALLIFTLPFIHFIGTLIFGV
jgi:hypothetical protein